MKWICDHSIVHVDVILQPTIYLQSVRRDSRREKAKDLSTLTYGGHIQQAYQQQLSHKL